MAGAALSTALVDPRNIPVPTTASPPDVEMHGPPTLEQNTFVDARSLHLMQQNVEVSYAGEAHAAAEAVRLAAELRFREYEDSARNVVLAEMQELRQVADATHEGRIAALTNRFNTFADEMRSELRSTLKHGREDEQKMLCKSGIQNTSSTVLSKCPKGTIGRMSQC